MARSGYYAWRQRQAAPGKRAAENAVITAEIRPVFQEHRGFYGSARIHQELRASGHPNGRHRVARLMQRAEFKALTRRAFRPCSRASSGAAGVVENLLQQNSSHRLQTAAGRVTSLTSAPQSAGGTWPSGSICSAAVSSVGSSITEWRPPW